MIIRETSWRMKKQYMFSRTCRAYWNDSYRYIQNIRHIGIHLFLLLF